MKYTLIRMRHTCQLCLIQLLVKYATMVCMEKTVVIRVDSVSTTLSATMSMEAVYKGVVQGTWEISVRKVWYIHVHVI